MNFPIPMLIYILLIISSSVIARKELKIRIESSWNGLSSDIIKVDIRSILLVPGLFIIFPNDAIIFLGEWAMGKR